MRQVAKLFFNGRSQAVRLPSAYRFKEKEVYIRRDPETGDVILSRKPGSWEDFFELAKKSKCPMTLWLTETCHLHKNETYFDRPALHAGYQYSQLCN